MFRNPIERQPYAVPGSWMSFFLYHGGNGMHPGRNGLYLRSNLMPDSGGGGDAIFKLILLDIQGNELPFSVECTPGMLTLQGQTGRTEILFDRPNRLRFRNVNSRLRLSTERKVTSIQQFLQTGPEVRALFCLTPVNFLLHIYPLSSNGTVKASTADGWIELAGDENALLEGPDGESDRSPMETFDEAASRLEQDFEEFRRSFPAQPGYEETRDQACFLLWSLRTSPRGPVRRPMTLVSRVKMSGCWAWDHCFPALASHDPQWAYDDFMVMLDSVDEQAGIHDLLSPGYTIDIYTKPPIHGWACSQLLLRHPHFFNAPERLQELYQALAHWQNYWTKTRDIFHRGMPCCFHGNDSGWDNSSLFLSPLPLSTPDIQAFLVLQAETLETLASQLHRPDSEREAWLRQRDRLLHTLLEQFSDGRQFYAVNANGEKCDPQGDSLQLFLPLLLEKRLPASLRNALLLGLKSPGRFLTPYGLATESISSDIYTPDGYWRGPIWAPPTLMLVHALRHLDETEFARQLATSFCDLCRHQGFYENFNALTGMGQRDSGMSWTASTFLILQEWMR